MWPFSSGAPAAAPADPVAAVRQSMATRGLLNPSAYANDAARIGRAAASGGRMLAPAAAAAGKAALVAGGALGAGQFLFDMGDVVADYWNNTRNSAITRAAQDRGLAATAGEIAGRAIGTPVALAERMVGLSPGTIPGFSQSRARIDRAFDGGASPAASPQQTAPVERLAPPAAPAATSAYAMSDQINPITGRPLPLARQPRPDSPPIFGGLTRNQFDAATDGLVPGSARAALAGQAMARGPARRPSGADTLREMVAQSIAEQMDALRAGAAAGTISPENFQRERGRLMQQAVAAAGGNPTNAEMADLLSRVEP